MNILPMTIFRCFGSRSSGLFLLCCLGLSQKVAAHSVLRVPYNYASIQDAIDASLDGDVVHVFPGTYEENIDFSGKAIQVIGIAGARRTTIDGSTSQYPEEVVRFWNEEGPDSVLRGFTVRGGGLSLSSTRGAGISGIVPFTFEVATALVQDCIIRNNSGSNGGAVAGDLTLERCLFFQNTSSIDGGAAGYGNLILRDCTFVRNSARDGGAILVSGLTSSVSVEVDGALFIENYANCSAQGGAIYAPTGSNVLTCNRAIFYHNATRLLVPGSSQHGGAIFLAGGNNGISAQGTLDHNTIVGNWEYPGSFSGSYIGGVSGMVDVTNSIAWGNRGIQLSLGTTSQVLYSDVMDGYSGTGIIDADPLFTDQAHYDFSLSPGSPCIDNGDPGFALDEDGTRTDMGAIPYDRRAAAASMGAGSTGSFNPMPGLRLPGPFDAEMRSLLEDILREDSPSGGGFLGGPRLNHVTEEKGETLELLGVPGALVVVTIGPVPLGPELARIDPVRPNISNFPASQVVPGERNRPGTFQAAAARRALQGLAVLATAILDENGEARIDLGPAHPVPLGAPPAFVEAWSRSPRWGHWGSSPFLQVQGL